VTRRSEFDRLKDVAKAAALGKFKQRLELLADIDAIGPTEAWLEGIPPGKIAHFAGEARVTDIADLRKVLNEDKRLTLIASLVHVVRAGVRDDVVTMFCKGWPRSTRRAATTWRRCGRPTAPSPSGCWACSAMSCRPSARPPCPAATATARTWCQRRTLRSRRAEVMHPVRFSRPAGVLLRFDRAAAGPAILPGRGQGDLQPAAGHVRCGRVCE
jgi:hypothetical protein